MRGLSLLADRLRLAAELGLHRHGAWWLTFGVVLGLLLCFAGVVIPRLEAELAAQQTLLGELRARAAIPPQPVDTPISAAAAHHVAFRAALAEDGEILPTIGALLDAAASHQLVGTRAEYVRAHDANAQAETLQMTVPVKGRYQDVRRWIEEILRTHAFLAVNELGFKREEIGVNQVEARVRLTLWHLPAGLARRLVDAGEVDP